LTHALDGIIFVVRFRHHPAFYFVLSANSLNSTILAFKHHIHLLASGNDQFSPPKMPDRVEIPRLTFETSEWAHYPGFLGQFVHYWVWTICPFHEWEQHQLQSVEIH
jgi:hypothetical protein